jgi:MFS family permease
MDRFGRKRTIQIGAAIATLGGVLQCSAANLSMILVGRIVAGWAVGLMSMSVPVYQAECAHPNIRGMIVGCAQQMIGVGFIVSTWVVCLNHSEREIPQTECYLTTRNRVTDPGTPPTRVPFSGASL